MKSIDNNLETHLFNQISAILEENKKDVSAENNTVIIFWKIGNVVNNILQKKRADYGKKVIINLSRQLMEKYGRDFEEKNFRRMLQFSEKFPDFEKVVTLSQKLSWSHFLALIPLKNNDAKEFYTQNAVSESWGVRNLRKAIANNLFEKTEEVSTPIEEKNESSEIQKTDEVETKIKADSIPEISKNETKILFTKTGIEDEVLEKIGANFTYDFKDFIKIENVKTKSFALKNHSIIFSSVNAVKSFFENGFKPNENFLDKNFNKIYAVGLKTKKEIRKNGFGTFKVKKNMNELSDFIIENSNKEKFLHFCGDLALDVLDRNLPFHNISYKKFIVYKTQLLYPKISEKFDAIVFFSPSGVRSFAKFNSLENVKLFSIGQTTEKELKKFTENRIFTSKENNLEDLISIVKSTMY